MFDSITSYAPYNEQEKKDKELIIYCTEIFEDILTRNNKVAHITSSAFAVNRSKEKVLMIHHNIYNSWSWIGGHADGEEDLLEVAMKELKEETGVKNFHPVSSDIFSLDVLTVLGHTKRGNYVSPHLHLSITYLIEVDENDLLIVKEDENSGVKWISIDELNIYSSEPHMHKVYEKLISKIKEML
ncbi:NUDIX domain-containing protein [Desulfosporosinus fructosivorans]|uniref:NUDIX domain-containing protein n=1 Tax=Desulfosporosinus fructosivorans TaxID=2018669 RepID=A0A4Z0QVS6_9FIRM|nr:NUDIX hydrolase [Desulfosporosinus fructosivorans]TGE34941.1 NUDIX domain-containing protein [Desulfosporosinus fructosivorans]